MPAHEPVDPVWENKWGARHLTLNLNMPGMTPVRRDFVIPKDVRYVAITIEGRPIGSADPGGPWEPLPAALSGAG